MRTTWSKVTSDWKGFQPVAYRFSDKAWKLPLKLYKGSGQSVQEQDSSFGGLIHELGGPGTADRPFRIQKIESGWGGGVSVTAESGTVRFGGPSFNVEVAKVLLDLGQSGISSFGVTLYYFDKDDCLDDPDTSYHFFVVSGDAIIRENISFFDHPESGFDPSILESSEEAQPIWFNEPAWRGAWTRYWYRRFYQETQTGKLMVLREDEPQIFHYARTPVNPNRAMSTVLMTKIYRLLWLFLPIFCAIAFPSVRVYMGIIAAAFAIDFLFVLWQLRKAGRT